MTPKRIQRKRTKGWRMPAGAVYVGRPTFWGNPFAVTKACPAKQAVRSYRRLIKTWSQAAIMRAVKFADDGQPAVLEALALIVWRNTARTRLHELRGKDLCCWCPLDQPCHADVLLELANALEGRP
jgi:hypothetical protein